MNFSLINRSDNYLQIAVEPQILLQMCNKALGGVKLVEIKELSSGHFNNTYLVDTLESKFVLRVSPHKAVNLNKYESQLMQREYNIQPYLIPACSLAPQTIYADFTRTLIDRDYVFQSYLKGELWEDIKENISKEENERIWFQIGEIAKSICSVNNVSFGYPAPHKQYEKWSSFVMGLVAGMRDDLNANRFECVEVDKYVEILKNWADVLDTNRNARLIHGDLWPKNILITKKSDKYDVTGVLDSERAYWGDEISEWIHYFLDVPQAYWDGYGELFNKEYVPIRKLLYRGMHYVLAILEQKTRYKRDVKWAVDVLSQINTLITSSYASYENE